MDKTLSQTQQELITNNFNLIYGFAKKKNLTIDDGSEYYDVVVNGLCKAARYFDAAKGSFTTFAYRCMQSELDDYYRALNNKSNIPEYMIFSLDALRDTSEETEKSDTFLDNIIDTSILPDELAASKSICSDMLALLNKNEKTIVQYILEGHTQKQIAEMMNCRQQNINRYVSKIKKKWAIFYSNYN